MTIKKIIKIIGNKLGYDIAIQKKSECKRGWHPDYLRQLGDPRTVIDIGVGRGTNNLYRAFPDKEFILFEPLQDFKPYIDKISKKYNCGVFYMAVGSKKGNVKIQVNPNRPTKTSFKTRTEETRSKATVLETRTIKMTTLDDFYRKNQGIKKPVLLKIDTEGYEMEVIKGANKFLKIVDTVIAEVSVGKRFHDSYQFEDFIRIMNKNGFSVFDILSITNFVSRPGTRYVDVVFKIDRAFK